MGCRLSHSAVDSEFQYEGEETKKNLHCIWRQQISTKEAWAKYFFNVPEGASIMPAHLEFRALLDTEFAMVFIKQFAKEIQKFPLICLWQDVQALKVCTHTRTTNIVWEEMYQLVISFSNPSSTVVVSTRASLRTAETVERMCFLLLYDQIYTPLLPTYNFKNMCCSMKKKFNSVNADDFEYYEKICEGAYGLVLHVKKKSTKEHYAMKVQGKALLLYHLMEDPMRILQEMQTLACCQHPFIMPLSYAFQTDILAIMVMPLCIYGDLGILILNSPHRRIPLPDAIFYSAEILSALLYLHGHGIMFRDLKPGNVLLARDGHCLLADFGAAIDLTGCVEDADISKSGLFRYYSQLKKNISSDELSDCGDNNGIVQNSESHFNLNMWSTAGTMDEANQQSFNQINSEVPQAVRAKSIVGTVAYMAPEIIFKFGSSALADTPYTYAVDYWSFGVTVYTMIYGKLPFRHVKVEKLQQFLIQVMVRPNVNHKQIFEKIFGRVTYSGVDNAGGVSCDENEDGYGMNSEAMSANASLVESFINGLLEFDPLLRSGIVAEKSVKSPSAKSPRTLSGIQMSTCIRSHAFYQSIDWKLLEGKQLTPPNVHSKIKLLTARKYEGLGLPNEHEFVEKVGFSGQNKAKAAVYSLEEALVRNGRNKWLLGTPLSAPCASLSSSRRVNTQYTGVVQVEQDEPIPVPLCPDMDSAEFYQINSYHQQMFAHWYYVEPAIVDSESKAQVTSRSYGADK